MFKGRRQSTSKEDGSGDPITALTDVNINTTKSFLRHCHRITLQALSEKLQISLGDTHMLATEKLNMRHVCVQRVPMFLILEQ